MTIVFLDVETTSLDAETGQVWEIAYAIDDGPVQSSIVEHTLDGADSKSLVISKYMQRHARPLSMMKTAIFESNLIAALDGATLAGANPRFDAAFLKKRWGAEPWHYRLLDVCAYVAGTVGLGYVPGLSEAADIMGEIKPDHTATQDVRTTQATFYAAFDRTRAGGEAS